MKTLKTIIFSCMIIYTILANSCTEEKTKVEKMPTADFEVNKEEGVAPFLVTFTNKSSGIINYTKWTFGDGTSSEKFSTEKGYKVAGEYEVTLIVANSGGSSTVTKKIKVTQGQPNTVTDNRDTRVYHTKEIGSQTWITENLIYFDANGSCYAYNNENNNLVTHGYLYNWQTAINVCPYGYHLPTETDWQNLINYLGGKDIAGGKMKQTNNWLAPNIGATNISGFSASPAGWYQNENSEFTGIGTTTRFWSATAIDTADVWVMELKSETEKANIVFSKKEDGCSVRCVKD